MPPTFADVAKIASAAKPITTPLISTMRQSFTGGGVALKNMQNALVENDIKKIAVNREIIAETDHSMSTQLDTWSCTNQKSSGRCWLFALLNLFRPSTAKLLNVKEFEFSQSHIHFWDKFERANHFMTAILETGDRDFDERTVHFLLG
jgi:bleomycin hydrolase